MKFIAAITDETKRNDAYKLSAIMQELSGEKPTMWGPSIIGFGSYHYRYESGREGDSLRIGFSPRANALTLYLPGIDYTQKDFTIYLDKLGKYTHAKGCMYIKKLSDINEEILKDLVKKVLTIHYS